MTHTSTDLSVFLDAMAQVTRVAHRAVAPSERASMNLLAHLERTAPCHLSSIVSACGLEQSTVSRYVARLAEQHLVSRAADPADKRAVVVQLTETGRATLADLRNRRVTLVQAAVADWPAGDLEQLGALLTRFAAGLEAAANSTDDNNNDNEAPAGGAR